MQDLGFLEAYKENTKDISFNEDPSLATGASDHLSTFVEPAQLADCVAISLDWGSSSIEASMPLECITPLG